jgi:hypothetical protein
MDAEGRTDGLKPTFVMELLRLHAHGPMTITELATSIDRTHSALHHKVAAMRAAGWIRTLEDEDARTKKGGAHRQSPRCHRPPGGRMARHRGRHRRDRLPGPPLPNVSPLVHVRADLGLEPADGEPFEFIRELIVIGTHPQRTRRRPRPAVAPADAAPSSTPNSSKQPATCSPTPNAPSPPSPAASASASAPSTTTSPTSKNSAPPEPTPLP